MSDPTTVSRRLVAVFAADVEGYSRLMGADEVGTLRGLTERRAILDRLIGDHGGRIANTAGDSVLAEFGSAVDAVECAVEAQASLTEANSSLPADKHINFRVGIHVGDVMVRAGDLFGDGVNIAARLQALAHPGGVYVSGTTYEQVRKVLPVAFTDMGLQQVKNIEDPIRAYSVCASSGGSKTASARESSGPLPLPDTPSVAVLPFQNMSGDPEQVYFADGIVEDIITALSRFKSLFVIARNSSFTYKGKTVDIKQVGRELGVRYVLEGSIRKAGDRVRITGQLIDASSGTHLWAEKFDGAIEDVFELQDMVTERVVGSIEPSIKQAEISRAHTKPTSNLDAYDYYLRALPPYYQFTREGHDAAVDFLGRAVVLDRAYALAKAFLAFIYVARWLQGWGAGGDRAKSLALAREAIAEDPNNPSALRWAGHALGFWGDYDRALAVLEKAARLNVNGSQVLNSLGWVKCYACAEPDRAIAHFERAMRLSPLDPEMFQMLNGIALAHLIAGRNEQALVFAQRAIDEEPRFTSSHRAKIVALGNLGRWHDAKAAADVLLTYDPGFTLSRLPTYRDADFQQIYRGGLKAVGIPD